MSSNNNNNNNNNGGKKGGHAHHNSKKIVPAIVYCTINMIKGSGVTNTSLTAAVELLNSQGTRAISIVIPLIESAHVKHPYITFALAQLRAWKPKEKISKDKTLCKFDTRCNKIGSCPYKHSNVAESRVEDVDDEVEDEDDVSQTSESTTQSFQDQINAIAKTLESLKQQQQQQQQQPKSVPVNND